MSSPESRTIRLHSAPNLRDLGGLPVDGGRVRPGEVYRSANIAEVSPADRPTFDALGVGTVFDLRTRAERQQTPDRLPEGITTVALDVLADSVRDAAAQVSGSLTDPAAMAATLGDGKAERLMLDSYRHFVSLPSALGSYRRFFLDLADPARSGAALFHCTTGKDRTGWGAAVLLGLLGADHEVIYADYLQTNVDLRPAIEPALDKLATEGVDPELLLPILTVTTGYLDAAYAEMDTRFGGLDGYLRDGLGLTDDVLAALTSRFVVTD